MVESVVNWDQLGQLAGFGAVGGFSRHFYTYLAEQSPIQLNRLLAMAFVGAFVGGLGGSWAGVYWPSLAPVAAGTIGFFALDVVHIVRTYAPAFVRSRIGVAAPKPPLVGTDTETENLANREVDRKLREARGRLAKAMDQKAREMDDGQPKG